MEFLEKEENKRVKKTYQVELHEDELVLISMVLGAFHTESFLAHISPNFDDYNFKLSKGDYEEMSTELFLNVSDKLEDIGAKD